MSNLRQNTAIYDLEIFPNYFILSVRYNVAGKTKDVIYYANDHQKFADVVAKFGDKIWWIGYNSKSYDNVMIKYWLEEAKDNIEQIYALNQRMIPYHFEKSGAFAGLSPAVVSLACEWHKNNVSEFRNIKTNRVMAYLKGEHTFKNMVDLFPLNESVGSLKNVAMLLHHPSIKETPIAFGSVLTEEQKLMVDEYCWTDIDVTQALYNKQEENLRVRDRFYGLGITDAHHIGSAKLAEIYVGMKEAHSKGIDYADWKRQAKATDGGNGTPREDMRIADLFPYILHYNDEAFEEFEAKLLSCSFTWNVVPEDDDEQEAGEPIVKGSAFAKERANKVKSNFMTLKGEHLTKGDLVLVDSRGNGFQVGVGGLHNLAPRGRWEANETHTLINVDVKSYYPSLIARNDFSPLHCPSYSKTIAGEFARRLAVKVEAKDANTTKERLADLKAEDAGLKLIMNSSFGKLKEKFSTIRDAKAHFSVTISGQILLLKLIDMIQASVVDCELINANTDGVCYYIARTELAKVRAVMKDWENIAGVELEEEIYKRWVQSSCNNYMAVEESGKIKSKGGEYKIAPASYKEALFGSVIRKGAFEKIINDVPIVDTIKGNKDWRDFMVSATAGGSTYFLMDGVAIVESKIRFIYAKNGVTLTKQMHHFLPSKVASGRKVAVLLECTDESFDWSNVDYDAYIQDAQELLAKTILFKTSVGTPSWFADIVPHIETLYGRSAKVYDVLTKAGMHLIPKVGKTGYTGVKPTDKSTWSLVPKDKSLGWALATGAEYGWLSIDIDSPKSLDPKLLEILQEHPSVKVFRGENDPTNGQRGAVLYKYSGEDLKSFSVIETHGFELMYGSKIQTLFGVHPSGEFYKLSGKPAEAPAQLIEYLRSIKKPRAKKVELIVGAPLEETRVQELAQKIADAFAGCSLLTEEPELCEDNSYRLEFNDNGGHWFQAFLRPDGRVHLHSNHSNFQADVLDQINIDLNADVAYIVVKKPTTIKSKKAPVKEPVVTRKLVSFEGLQSYEEFIGHAVEQEQHLFVQGSTGSGKSYSMINYAWSHTHNADGSLNGNSVLIVTSDNRNIDQLFDSYIAHHNENKITDESSPHYVICNADEIESWERLKGTAKVVISNHHHLLRKGKLSVMHYDLMSWIDKQEIKPLILIDEADVLYSTLKIEIPLSVRYAPISGSQKFVNVHQRCMSSAGKKYSCAQCDLRNESMVTHNPLKGSVEVNARLSRTSSIEDWQSEQWADLLSCGAFRVVSEHKQLHKSEMAEIVAKVLERDCKALGKRKMTTEQSLVAEGIEPTFNAVEVMTDIVDSCYQPMLISNVFDDSKARKLRDELPEKSGRPASFAEISKALKDDGLAFPYHPCNTWHFQGFDMASLSWMSNKSTIVLMSATITDAQRAFFDQAIAGLQYETKAGVFIQLDDLLIITTPENANTNLVKGTADRDFAPVAWTKMIGETSYLDAICDVSRRTRVALGDNHLGQRRFAQASLVITATKADIAKDGLHDVKQRNRGVLGVYDTQLGLDETTQKTTLVAYSRSTLARGINLGEYGIVYTDTQSYKPALAYDWLVDTAPLEEMQRAEQTALVTQAVGRIIRKPQLEAKKDCWASVAGIGERKVIVIHNADAQLGLDLKVKLQGLVKNEIKILHYSLPVIESVDDVRHSILRCTKSAETFLALGVVKNVAMPSTGTLDDWQEKLERFERWTDFRRNYLKNHPDALVEQLKDRHRKMHTK